MTLQDAGPKPKSGEHVPSYIQGGHQPGLLGDLLHRPLEAAVPCVSLMACCSEARHMRVDPPHQGGLWGALSWEMNRDVDVKLDSFNWFRPVARKLALAPHRELTDSHHTEN